MTEPTPAAEDELEHKEIAFVRFAPWKNEHGTQKLTVTSGRTVYPMNYSTAIAIHAYVESQRRPLLNTADPHHTPATEDERERFLVSAVNDAVDYDSRKTLLDVFQESGGKVHTEQALGDLYGALMAVAKWGARRVIEDIACEPGFRLHPTPSVDDVARRLSAIREAMSGTKNFKCGVCTGHSHQSDGHIKGCEGWAREELTAVITLFGGEG